MMKPEAIQRLVTREDARRGRGEADSYLDRNSWERCISRTLPVAMIPNLYNNFYQIIQTPYYVVIQMEMIHEARIIPVDGRPHASERIRQWLGDSRGHWEGTTLVETVASTTSWMWRLAAIACDPDRTPEFRKTLRCRALHADQHRHHPSGFRRDPAAFTGRTVAIPVRKAAASDRLFEYATKGTMPW
jgi:hypothetical protein